MRLLHRAALAGLLPLAGCFDITLPGGGGDFANTAFGKNAVLWATPDSVGGMTMQPALNAAHVFFERDMVVAGGRVTAPAELVALERGTGAVAWHQPIITGENAALAGSRVAAAWGGLPIFDAASGSPLHTYRFRTTSLASNVVSDGARFYVATYDGYAVAVDPATGAAAWETRLAAGDSGTVGFGVAISGETVAIGLKHFGRAPAFADSGVVAVVERSTGALRWRANVGNARLPGISEPPVITSGLVIVVTQSHDVRAYDVQTGALRWQASTAFGQANMGSDGLAACDGLVIVPSGDLGLVALEAATGTVRWRLGNLKEGSLRSVQCSHGTVLTLGAGLRVFDSATGAARATYPRRHLSSWRGREFWITSAVRDEKSIYVGTTHGYARIKAP